MKVHRPGDFRHYLLALVGVLACAPAVAGHAIGALGRLYPESGVIGVTAPPGEIISAWHVAAEDRVEPGQLLATLASAAALERSLADSERQAQAIRALQEARGRFQSALIRLEEVRLAGARADLGGYKALLPGAATNRELEQRRSAVAEAEARLKAEKLRLQTIEAEGALETARAEAAVGRARDALAAAQVRAPIAGTVLSLKSRVGDSVGERPLLEVADLGTMLARCDVFAGDLVQVAVGQRAEVQSDTLGFKLAGKVVAVSRVVDGNRSLGSVTVRLDDPGMAARVIGLEVQVTVFHDG